jgi:transaldolase
MTTNPTIFEKAIGGSELYDEDIRKLASAGRQPAEIFEALAVEDVRAACDLFLPVYHESRGMDGLVSMEVSPALAHDTGGTIAEAERLWSRIARPNAMIKIPGTSAGLPAISHCLSLGINVNVTLLFAVTRYREVVEAFLTGLERRAAAGKPVAGVASVASFFVSRVDGKVGGGTAAIANAAVAYQAFEGFFATARWKALAGQGAMVQRPLWASTSTKDPSLPDVYYVEALIAPNTVNTLPPATFAAYRDHGRPAVRIQEAIARSGSVLSELAQRGVELDQVTHTLEVEGVTSFAASFDSLLKVIEQKAAVLV